MTIPPGVSAQMCAFAAEQGFPAIVSNSIGALFWLQEDAPQNTNAYVSTTNLSCP